MADTKENALTANTTLANTDNVRFLKDVSGTLTSRRITVANFITSLFTLKVITSQFVLFNQGSGMASTTNGATSPSQVEATTNKQNHKGWLFPTALQRYVEMGFPMPNDYNGGTVTAQFYWTANSSSTNSVVWGLQGRAYADNDAIDAAWGTAQEVTDANGASAYTKRISSATSAITLAGSPAAGQWVYWRAYRLGSGADTLVATAELESVLVTYTRA